MKQQFPGFYRPSNEEFSDLWKDCTLVLDANVLLNLYRYSPVTRQDFLSVLYAMSDRLWVPHQAGLEFQRNRIGVIEDQATAYSRVKDALNDIFNRLAAQLSPYRRHPIIQMESIISQFETLIRHLLAEIDKESTVHAPLPGQDPLADDQLRDEIDRLVDGKVGTPYSDERLHELYRTADKRFQLHTPPGYRDTRKQFPDRYGDFVLWSQLLDRASQTAAPIIMVTDDRKEDWWWIHEGRILGPRPELIQEMQSVANVQFYMYQSDRFIEYARTQLNIEFPAEAITEIQTVASSATLKQSSGLLSLSEPPTLDLEQTIGTLTLRTIAREWLNQRLARRHGPLQTLAGTQDPFVFSDGFRVGYFIIVPEEFLYSRYMNHFPFFREAYEELHHTRYDGLVVLVASHDKTKIEEFASIAKDLPLTSLGDAWIVAGYQTQGERFIPVFTLGIEP